MTESTTEILRLVIEAKSEQARGELKKTEQSIKDFSQRGSKDADELKKKLSEVDQRISQLEKSAASNLGKAGNASKQMASDTQKAMDQVKQSTGTAEKAVTDLGQSAVASAALVNTGMNSVAQSTTQASTQVAASVDKASESIQGLHRDINGRLRDASGRYVKDADQMVNSTNKFSESTVQLKSKGTEAFGALAASSTVAFGAIAASIALAAKASGDLQVQLNTLQAVSGAAASEIAAVKERAQALGQTSGFTSTQIATAAVELGKMGFASSEVIDSLDGIVAAAAASGTGLAQTGELVAGTIRGFGLSAKDAQMVADVLAKAANASALGFEDMALSMKYVAPVAQASGQKLTDMVGIMGILSNSMIKGETAGTALRSMMVSLQAPSGEAGKYIKQLGLEVADSQGKIKSMPEIIGQLQDKLSKFNQKSQNKILAEVFGSEALPAASVLMKTTKEDLAAMIEQMEKANGSSKEMAKVMQQGLNAEVGRLNAKVNALAQDMGDRLSPALEGVVKFLQGFLDVVSKLPNPVKDTAAQVALLALAVSGLALSVGGAVSGGGKLLKLMKDLALAAPGVKAALTLLSGPVGWVIGGVTAATMVGLNVQNDLVNQQIGRDDKENALKSKQAAGQGDLNALLRKSDGGKDLSKLNRQEIEEALKAIQQVKVAADAKLKIERDLVALQKQYDSKSGAFSVTGQMTQKQSEELKVLKNKIENQKKLIEAEKQTIQDSHDLMTKYVGLEKTFDAELKKRPVSAGGTDNVSDDEADKAEKEKNQKLFKSWEEQDKAFEASMKNQLSAKLSSLQQQLNFDKQTTASGKAMANEMVENAHRIKSGYKECFWGVKQIIAETLGDWGAGGVKYLGPNGKSYMPGGSAYMAADMLAKDKRFQKVQFDAKNPLSAIQNGDILVYQPGAGGFHKKHGHIEVADKTNMMGYYGQTRRLNISESMAKGMSVYRLAGAGGSGSDQKAIQEAVIQQQMMNQEVDYYNKQLAKAVSRRSELGSSGKQDTDAWRDANSKVEHYKNKITELQGEIIDTSAKAAEELAKLQEANFNSLTEKAVSIRSNMRQSIDAMSKALFQNDMSPLEKMSDDFDREVKAREQEVSALEQSLQKLNLTEQQRAIINNQIKLLQRDITDLIILQDETMNNAENKIAWQQWRDKKALEEDILSIADEAIAKELTGQRQALDLKKQELELSSQMGADASSLITEKIDLQKEYLQLAKDELAYYEYLKEEEEKLGQESTKYNNIIKGLKQDVLKLTNDGYVLQKEAQDVVLSKLKKEREIREQILGSITQALNASNGMNESMGGASNILGGMLSGLQKFTGLFKKSDGQALDLMQMLGVNGKGGIKGFSELGKALSLPSGGIAAAGVKGAATGSGTAALGVGAIDPMVGMVMAAVGEAEKNAKSAADFLTKLTGGDIFEKFTYGQTLQQTRNASSMNLNRIEIDRARRNGQDTSQMEKGNVLKQQENDLLELEKTAIKLNLKKALDPYNGDIKREIDLFNQTYGDNVKQIWANTQAEMERIETERLERIKNISNQTYQDIANTQKTAALMTGTQVDDIEADRQAQIMKEWEDWSRKVNDIIAAKGALNPNDPNYQAQLDTLNRAEAAATESRETGVQYANKTAKDKLDTDDLSRRRAKQSLDAENAALEAKLTDDRYDDLQAEHEALVEKLNLDKEAELKEAERTGASKAAIERKYQLLGLTEEQRFLKAKQDARKAHLQELDTEYKQMLNQQKTLMQEQLDSDKQQWLDLIDVKKAALDELEAQMRREEQRLERIQEKKAKLKDEFDANDTKEFNAKIKGLNTDPLAWAGVKEISNTENVPGLTNVSGETAHLGLLKKIEMIEKQADINLKKELIDRKEFTSTMMDAQVMRAKAAEMALKDEKLTTEERMTLDEEWANAYVEYQKYAKEAIDARYESQEKLIQKNLDSQNKEIAKTRETIDHYNRKIAELETGVSKNMKLIDKEILRVDQTTRNWGQSWVDVARQIEKVRRQFEQARAEGVPLNGGGFSIPQMQTATNNEAYDAAAALLKQYNPLSIPKMAKGGGIRGSQYRGDRFRANLDDEETIMPLKEWIPQVIQPMWQDFNRQQAGPTYVTKKTVIVRDNQFNSDVDVTAAVQAALDDRQDRIDNQAAWQYG